MNVTKDIFEGKWEQIRAQSKIWWSLLTDDDLTKVDKAPIKFDKYIMLLRVKYGYTREHAREEINRRVTALDASLFTNFRNQEKKKLKLSLLFILMDFLIVLAYPVVFTHGQLRKFSKPAKGVPLVNIFVHDPAGAGG